jgi:E3 ubiquitin-protein ligase SHPRH
MESIGDVLSSMLEKTISALASEERKLILNSANQCHVKELQKDFDGAVSKYMKDLNTVRNRIKDMEVDMEKRLQDNLIQQDDMKEENITQAKVRIKTWKELEHRIVFFIASAFHNQGNENNVSDDSEIRTLENRHYEEAAEIRSGILREFEDDAKKAVLRMEKEMKKTNQILEEADLEPFDMTGGLVIHEILEAALNISLDLDKQLELIVDYRHEVYTNLTSPLEGDGEENNENPTGEEFEKGVVAQDHAIIYQDELMYLLFQRKRMIGMTLQYPENRTAVMDVELVKSLKTKRIGYDEAQGSLKDCVQKLRAILNEYQSVDRVQMRYLPEVEYAMSQNAIQVLSDLIEANSKVISALEKDVGVFSDVYNERLKYFAQLNKLSDGVMMPQWEEDVEEVKKRLMSEQSQIQSEIAKLFGRKRYFEYLQKDTDQSNTERECGSCHITFERGVFTACGHWYCGDCTKSWIMNRKRCPMCNQHINVDDLVHISFKRRRLVDVPHQNMDHFDNIPIEGSHGTKIDSLIRHILSILNQDPETKILCFSQWKTMLEIFGSALEKNNIGYIALEGQGWNPSSKRKINFRKQGKAVVEFNTNPHINVFMLNAKSQSSGLTLVCATHVFLIEPVLQKGLEQQAINRVHRIGQTKPTFVWRYLIQDTIEDILVQLADNHTKAPAVEGKDRGEHIQQDILETLFGHLRDSYMEM